MRPARAIAHPRRSDGAALILLIALLTLGALSFFLSNLTPSAVESWRQQQSDGALNQAREALIGYAVRYRELQIASGTSGVVYGYLPLPDLGSSRNNNAGCSGEGCDAGNFSGNAANVTVIGRFPWRTLGTGPLRDAWGECLWYAVSGSHQRIQAASPMNWDALSHLDVVVAKGTAAMASAIATAHDRPIAVIFSPGPALNGQNRSTSTSDDVTECGGNYSAANYLDPGTATALDGTSNYFAGATNQASLETNSTAPKALTLQGAVSRLTSGLLTAGGCVGGSETGCAVAANDKGVALSGDQLFRVLRGSGNFRGDINSLLDRMSYCLRDQIAGGSAPLPDAISGYTAPSDKSAGRIPAATCYADSVVPLGYFSHYRDQIFLAKANSGSFKAAIDSGAAQDCVAALIFANQRGSGQSRSSASEIADPANYLEGTNLTGFRNVTAAGTTAFEGPSLLAQVSATQTIGQDIVRCIPSGASFSTVTSANLSSSQQMVAYDAASSTLSLGNQDITSSFPNYFNASYLFGCAWLADTRSLGSGLRSYFRFSFATLGTSVGNTGFVFALIDSESNPVLPCGAAGSHLGYSGDNGDTQPLAAPKLGIEFDQARNAGFTTSSQTSTNSGRNDPCGTSGCGGTAGYNSHAAIVYWGHEASNATDGATSPAYDDNVHGFPTAASLATTRRPPTNPATAPGIDFVNLRTGGDVFHVRVEVTPTRVSDAATPQNSYISLQTKVWILKDSATVTNQIAAMQDTTRPMSLLYSSFAETLSDTAKVFDVAGSACVAGTCTTGQTCGTDNICYRKGLNTVRLGFTGSQRTQDQDVTINNLFTTWLP